MATPRTLGLLVALSLSVAAPARAQDAAPASEETTGQPENVRSTRQARAHFMEGLEHFRAHRYREAIQAFTLAAQLVPSADLHYNIARAHEELSEYEAAIEGYQRYLRDRVDPPDRAQVETHIEQLRAQAAAAAAHAQSAPTTGTLRLTANRAGADVTLDGEDAGQSPWEEARELPAGRHALALSREGYVPFRSEVSVEAGVPTAAYADLVPETRYRATQGDRIFTWIAWGLGLASVGAAIGLGVEAASRQGTDLDDARTWAAFSDVFAGAAVGLGVVGLILWFVEGRTVGTEQITVDEDDASGVRGP